MQFMTALFGESTGTLLNTVFALGIVLALILLALWGLKQFTRASERMSGNRRRLTVVESAAVDGKRKVLLIRRDNVEHLILTGGPQDVVVETGIAPAEPVAPSRPVQPAVQAAPDSIETPIAPDRPVSLDTVDKLDPLTRPTPLRPRSSLRHTNLLRPVMSGENQIIPMAAALHGDISTGPASDSANTGSVDLGGHSGLGSRNRFFKRNVRDLS